MPWPHLFCPLATDQPVTCVTREDKINLLDRMIGTIVTKSKPQSRTMQRQKKMLRATPRQWTVESAVWNRPVCSDDEHAYTPACLRVPTRHKPNCSYRQTVAGSMNVVRRLPAINRQQNHRHRFGGKRAAAQRAQTNGRRGTIASQSPRTTDRIGLRYPISQWDKNDVVQFASSEPSSSVPETMACTLPTPPAGRR